MAKFCKCGHSKEFHDTKLLGTGFCDDCSCSEFLNRDKKDLFNQYAYFPIAFMMIFVGLILNFILFALYVSPESFGDVDGNGNLLVPFDFFLHLFVSVVILFWTLATNVILSLLKSRNKENRKSFDIDDKSSSSK